MPLYSTSDELLYNLEAVTGSEAKRKWRQAIKEKWNYECAYCGSEENLTLDHITPRSKGHEYWKLWYVQQDFYNEDSLNKVEDWMKLENPTNLYRYRPRRNNAS